MYLVEINKVELIPEGHGKKNVNKNKRMFRCLILKMIINSRSVFKSAEIFKDNWKDERKYIIYKVFYVVWVIL